MSDVVFLGPSYPSDMPLFTRGLAAVGARVIGVGDQHADAVPHRVREALTAYIKIDNWFDEDQTVATVLHSLKGHNVDLVETLWEPLVVTAARLREAIGVPGLDVHQAMTFRDKGLMKQQVEAAGIRTPRSVRVDDGRRVSWRGSGDRLPDHHQTDLRSGFDGHVSDRG